MFRRDYEERRTPHGVRGLKSDAEQLHGVGAASHPSWGARIEILRWHRVPLPERRTPHGVRGLKYVNTLSPIATYVAPLMGCED